MRSARALSFLTTAALIALTFGLAFVSRDSVHETRWQMAGQLASPRALAAAVALPSGEILIVGGIDNDEPDVVRTTTEIVDPFTGASHVLAQHLPGRVNHTATLAGDVVVVAGGTERIGESWYAWNRVDLFDVKAHAWRKGAAMSQARSDHGAVLLRDGRLLVVGGTDGPRILSSVEIYDPRADRWSDVAPLPDPRSQFTMATLKDGRVLVAGGLVRGLPSSWSVIYDPTQNVWTEGPRMQFARVLHTSVKLPGGDLLLIGGQRDASGTAERYDFRLNEFIPAGTLVHPRMLGAAIAIPDGRVLLAGGLLVDPGRNKFSPMPDAEIWDADTERWNDAVDPHTPRALGSFVVTEAGALWIGGASDGERALDSIERLTWR